MTPNKPDSDRVLKMKEALLLDGNLSRSPFPDWLKIVGDISYNEMWEKQIDVCHIRPRDRKQPELDNVEHLICLNRPEHGWHHNGLTHPEYGRITGYEYMWMVIAGLYRLLVFPEFRWGEDFLWLDVKVGQDRIPTLIEIVNKELPTTEGSPPKN